MTHSAGETQAFTSQCQDLHLDEVSDSDRAIKSLHAYAMHCPCMVVISTNLLTLLTFTIALMVQALQGLAALGWSEHVTYSSSSSTSSTILKHPAGLSQYYVCNKNV